ncbi:MAG: histidine triad nucleotide-binding protein [Planctomycetes bacterium]|nr:histidine triad nucleotide-binding protein [Planctomycetota bacterium]
MTDTIFGKIASGQAQADIVYEDDRALAFRDLNPQAPTHLLVIPRKPLATLSEADSDDQALLGHLLLVANRVASEAGLENYRVVVNNGAGAGQTVFHLHLHVLGGRNFSWPPG